MTTLTKPRVRNNQATHFKVVTRRCENWEPAWVVVREGSGQSTDAVAHFYNQYDAEQYAEWRNKEQHRYTP